jgi:Ser/Thr protein kinase RdoA (MazF antagonist)
MRLLARARESEMRYVHAAGYPVPEVHEVRDAALVVDRVGPTLQAITRGAIGLDDDAAAELARLHAELHAIAAPPGLGAAGRGDALLHLDMHPENVLVIRAARS